MGSKVKVIDTQDKRFNRFGYVCDWKYDNESGITAVLVQMIPDSESVRFSDDQISEVSAR